MAGLVPAIHVLGAKERKTWMPGISSAKTRLALLPRGMTNERVEQVMADNDDIPFNRDFPLKPGVVEEARPGVRRVLCNNPSPFTFTGTVSYIVGRGKVAIIDPGPDDEAHARALLDAVKGETVTHILVTHTHRDHSPNTGRIKAATGAPVYAEGPHRASRPRFESEKHNPESGADREFRPDIQIKHGEVIE